MPYKFRILVYLQCAVWLSAHIKYKRVYIHFIPNNNKKQLFEFTHLIFVMLHFAFIEIRFTCVLLLLFLFSSHTYRARALDAVSKRIIRNTKRFRVNKLCITASQFKGRSKTCFTGKIINTPKVTRILFESMQLMLFLCHCFSFILIEKSIMNLRI